MAVASEGGARARIEEIRRSLTTTTDVAARARLRVRLADVLSALGEVDVAAVELRQAAVEAPPSAGLMFAVRALAPRLRPEEAASLRAAARAGRPSAAPAAPRPRARRSTSGEPPLGAAASVAAAPAPVPLPPLAREAAARGPSPPRRPSCWKRPRPR